MDIQVKMLGRQLDVQVIGQVGEEFRRGRFRTGVTTMDDLQIAIKILWFDGVISGYKSRLDKIDKRIDM